MHIKQWYANETAMCGQYVYVCAHIRGQSWDCGLYTCWYWTGMYRRHGQGLTLAHKHRVSNTRYAPVRLVWGLVAVPGFCLLPGDSMHSSWARTLRAAAVSVACSFTFLSAIDHTDLTFVVNTSASAGMDLKYIYVHLLVPTYKYYSFFSESLKLKMFISSPACLMLNLSAIF